MAGFKNCEWDSEYFGFKVAELAPESINATDLQQTLQELKSSGVKLVYWRVNDDDRESSLAAEACGGFFAGCQATYEQPNTHTRNGLESKVSKFLSKTPDENLNQLAIQSGLYSRYNNDKKISKQHFEGLYRTWIAKCASGELADAVLVAERDGQMAGMVAVKEKGTTNSIVLIAVEEKFRGSGVGNDLVSSALSFGSEMSCTSHSVVTYKENAAACGLFEKWGYKTQSLLKFYHFWL